MKCELAAALIHKPKILFLDEPTIGLDVTMHATMRRFIQRYNEETGATVMLTSHYMDDVSALCPRVIVIHNGSIRHDGPLAGLVQATSPDKLIRVRLSEPMAEAEVAELQVAGARLRISQHDAGALHVLVSPNDVIETVRVLLQSAPVADLRVEDPPLEDVMQTFFGQG
jgi:ABC-2 type transport system ATP-binding protein